MKTFTEFINEGKFMFKDIKQTLEKKDKKILRDLEDETGMTFTSVIAKTKTFNPDGGYDVFLYTVKPTDKKFDVESLWGEEQILVNILSSYGKFEKKTYIEAALLPSGAVQAAFSLKPEK